MRPVPSPDDLASPLVWRGAWFLLSAAYFRAGNHERPERVLPVLLEPEAVAAVVDAGYHKYFQTVAKRAGRPDPWPPEEPSPSGDRSSTRHATTWPSSLGIDSHGGHF